MSSDQREGKGITAISQFFNKALIHIQHPVAKFLVVLTVALLLAFLFKDDLSSDIAFMLLIIVFSMFAILMTILHIYDKRFKYEQKMIDSFKNALREEIKKQQSIDKSKNDE